MNTKKGFTLIELIVVIAIIAILAAIVLVNVTQYIAKAKDATIQANTDTIKTNAAAFYASNSNGWGAASSTWAWFKLTSDYTVPAAAIVTSNAGDVDIIGNDYGAFCISAKLSSSAEYWCEDSTGAAKTTAASCTASTVCP